MPERYSKQFSPKDHTQGPYPEAHTIAGEKVPPDGQAQPQVPVGDCIMRASSQSMPIGLSYPAGRDFGPYVQHCGEGLYPKFQLSFIPEVPFSCGNVHPHTGLLLFALALNQRPICILETGTFYGYSTWFLAEAMRLWGDGGLVHTIENNPAVVPDVVRNHPNVRLHVGLSQLVIPKLLQELGEVQFAFLDSWKRQALAELQLVDPAIPPGGIVVIHDTQFLNTGRTTYEALLRAGDKSPYEMMLFGGIPHRENPHRFFGNADDRGLLVLHRKGGVPFLDVADSESGTYGSDIFYCGE